MDHMELARTLRADTETHYNCCQSVLVTFAREMGLSKEEAFALGTFFNSGMRHGSVCGACPAPMMVLGMTGCGDQEAAAVLHRFKEGRGATDCATLLKAARDRGEERKLHCDGLVYDMVQAVDEILAKKQ